MCRTLFRLSSSQTWIRTRSESRVSGDDLGFARALMHNFVMAFRPPLNPTHLLAKAPLVGSMPPLGSSLTPKRKLLSGFVDL